MKHILFPLILGTALIAAPAFAADTQDHQAHHPDSSTAGKTPALTKPATSATGTKQGMEMQMKCMQEMHDKMMNAKTPEERKALMDEHMKTMQSSMSMMKEMGAQKDKMGSQGMQMRMDMMEMMMQMMMDRMSAMPTQ